MDKNGVVGEILEKGQQISDSVQSSAKTQVKNVVGDITGQIGRQESSPDQNTTQNQQNQSNLQFIKDLYGVSESTSEQNQNIQSDPVKHQKELEDKKKLQELRHKLHQEFYYDPLVNPSKQTEESTAEKLERQEQEKEAKEMTELQEEKKKEPIAVTRAKTKAEIKSGIAG